MIHDPLPFTRESEMATRVRAFDWAVTPLGPLTHWSRSLRTAVGICLGSRFPMFVWWGPELVNIYNDAYIPVLGQRHPDALGRPARAIWGEIWDVLGPQSDAVLLRGEATWNERVPLVMERNGFTEPTWFTWSYSPIPDEDGAIGGLFCACTEDTARVTAERERDRLAEQRQLALDSARMGWWHLDTASGEVTVDARYKAIFDVSGDEFTYRSTVGLLHPDDQPRVEAAVRAALVPRNPVPYDTEYRVVHQDGSLRDVRATGWAGFEGEGDARHAVSFAGTVLDVTEQRRAEARARFLVGLDDAVRGLTDPDEITLTAATLLGRHLDVDRCAYAEIDDDQDGMNITGNYTRGVPSIVGRLRFSDFGAEVLRLMRDNLPFVVQDVDHHDPPIGDPAAYRATQIQAVICVPLHKAGRFVAAMAVHAAQPRRWRSDEVELALLVANRCWESLERARIARDLGESEASLRHFIDTANEGVLRVGPDDRISYANDHHCRMLGYAPGEMVGIHSLDLVFPEDLPAAAQRRAERRNQSRSERYEMRMKARDGSSVWVLNSTVVVHRDGRYDGTYSMMTDISDRRRIEEAVRQALEAEQSARGEAERVSRMKDEFLTTLSHELRTPLTAILGWSHLLRTGSLQPEAATRAIETIERSARAQTQLVEDLLDMSRIVAGKARLDVQRVDLADVVGAALESVQPSAEAKGVRLEKLLDPYAGPISGDPARLQQILWNLLSNAIKFTPRGGRVQVLLERVNSHVEISVSDTGVGIAPEFLPHLFERFRQADSSMTRRYGGLGLGLSIVKQLVDMHNGQVRAKSTGVGGGATFIVALPLAILKDEETRGAHPKAAVAIPDEPEAPRLDGVQILVIDDEPDARALMRQVFENYGAEVRTAEGGPDGLKALAEARPDLIVSDIGMPEMDGFELIRRVRLLGANEGGTVPAVAVTAFARSEDRRRALLSGFQSHIAKPMDPQELVAVAASVLGRV